MLGLLLALFSFLPGALAAASNQFPYPLMNPTGRTVAVWNVYDAGSVTVQAATRETDGTWSTSVDLSGSLGSSLTSGTPVLYMNPTGDAVAVWSYFDSLGDSFVAAAMLPVGTSVWNVDQVSGSGEVIMLDDQRLAINQDGALVLMWSHQLAQDLYELHASNSTVGTATDWSTPIIVS